MPPRQQVHRDHDGQEFQTPKEHLMCRKVLQQPLRRLGQPEDRPQIHRRGCDQDRRRENLELAIHDFSRLVDEQAERQDEHRERKDLKRQSRQQDVVRGRGILLVRIRRAHECRTGDLHHRRDHITDNENPEDQFRPQGRVLPTDGIDHDADDGVDGRGEEHRRDHDAEVLGDEVRDRIGIFPVCEQAEGVADEFHH